MSLVTTSYASEWDALLGVARSTLVASHRATTSSRHPGRVFRGAVYVDVRTVVVCAACGGSRRVGSGPHAPRMAAGRLVDCVGREVLTDVDEQGFQVHSFVASHLRKLARDLRGALDQGATR